MNRICRKPQNNNRNYCNSEREIDIHGCMDQSIIVNIIIIHVTLPVTSVVTGDPVLNGAVLM